MRSSTCWKSADAFEAFCCPMHSSATARSAHWMREAANRENPTNIPFKFFDEEGKPSSLSVPFKALIVAFLKLALRLRFEAASEAILAILALLSRCHFALHRDAQDSYKTDRSLERRGFRIETALPPSHSPGR